MGFKLTYRDGQADDYDDTTKWEVEGGVLKMGREAGRWTVLVSPGHWATIELTEDGRGDARESRDGDDSQDSRDDDDSQDSRDDDEKSS